MADDVAFRFTSSGASQVKRDLDSMRSSASQLGKDASSSATHLTAASDALTKLSRSAAPLAAVNPVLGNLTDGASTLASTFAKVDAGVTEAGAGLGTRFAVGAGLATGSLLTLAAVGEKSFVSLGRSIKDVQNVTGLAAEDASRLVAVTNSLGIPAEAAATAFFRFGKNVETNVATLQKYGVQIAHNQDGTVNMLQTLYAVADAYQRNSDQTQRNALVQASFGRGGQALIEILQRTRGELEGLASQADKSGLVFNQDQLDQVENFGIAMQQLRMAGEGLAISLARGVTPAMTTLADVLTPVLDLLNRTGIMSGLLGGLLAAQLVRGIAAAVSGAASLATSFVTIDTSAIGATTGVAGLSAAEAASVAPATQAAAAQASLATSARTLGGPGVVGGIVGIGFAIYSLAQHAHSAGDEVQRLARLTTEQLAGEFARAGDDLLRVGVVTKDVRDKFKALAEQSPGTAKRVIDGLRAMGVPAAGIDALQKILDDTTAAMARAAADAGGAAGGFDELGASADSAASKVLNLGTAFGSTLDKFSAAQNAARGFSSESDKLASTLTDTGSGTDQAKLDRDSADAADNLAQARQRQADAEQKLREAIAGVTPLERQRLQVSLEQARVSAGQAALDLSAAQERLSRLSAGASPKQRAEAAQAVAAAQAQVDDANTRVQESQKAIDDAAPGSAQYAKNVAEAERGVADAKRAVADAQDKATESAKKAANPTKTLADHQREVADQLDRVVQAAKGDWAAQIASGAVTATGGVYGLAATLQGLADKFPALADAINTYLAQLPGWATTPIQVSRNAKGEVTFKGFASGGHVTSADGWVTVGERGYEYMRLSPGSSAQVYSHQQSRSMTIRGAAMADGGIVSRTPTRGWDGGAMSAGHMTVENYNGDVIAKGLTLDEVRREQRKDARVKSLSRGSRARG